MARFRGTIPAKLTRQIGVDVYGRPLWGLELTLKVTLVKYRMLTQKGPQGNDEEMVATGRALIGPLVQPQIGDQLEVFNCRHHLLSATPYPNFQGEITHYECDLGRIV